MKKAFISADIEGMEGNVSRMQSNRGNPDYPLARKRLAEDVNAAIRACFDSGYDEVYVCDGHGDMENLIIEDMDPRCKLISGAMRSSLQMEGIDSSFDAYISFGHAGAGLTIGGVIDHCYNGGKIYNLRFNGVTMNTETVANGLVAGFYGVPLVACIGDKALAEECKAFVPNMEAVVVKEGRSRFSAVSVHPTVAREMIYNGVKAALARIDEIKPIECPNPLTMEIDFKDSNMADTASLVPGVVRLSPRTVSFTSDPETVFKVHELLFYRVVDVLA
ncbi:MAG: M55 family metallopeptidase [Clostridia bacterium]|nr:M55 family metallopeptidase [Clostridia bacterium]MBQ3062864.1 M55 family metallopeptidase [Clostridia bacterium]